MPALEEQEEPEKKERPKRDLTWRLHDAGINLRDLKRGKPRQGLARELVEAGVGLPGALTESVQKPPQKRHKKSRGKERPQQQPRSIKMGIPEQQHELNVPPAGGDKAKAKVENKATSSDVADRVADRVVTEFQPAVDALAQAAGRVSDAAADIARAKGKSPLERGMDIGEFTIKGGIALGLVSAAGFIGRSLWRNRNAHLAVD